MSHDWDSLREAASAASFDIERIRHELDPAWVLSQRGIAQSGMVGGRFQYPCPFHNDTNPSFSTWRDQDGVYRAGCWSCENRFGDVIDLLRWFGETNSIARAQELLDGQPDDFVSDATRYVQPDPVDIHTVYNDIAASMETWPIKLYCDAKETEYDSDFLRNEWGVRGLTTTGEILIPHFNKSDILVGLKHRNATTPTITYRGSHFTQLYGEWRDDGRSSIILCEGESDTWLASFIAPDAVCLGLPSGGNQAPSSFDLSLFTGRSVVLAFDSDPTGRLATDNWLNALEGIATDIRVAPIPDGRDLSNCGNAALYLAQARMARAYNGSIIIDGAQLVRRGGRGDTPVSNWYIEATRELEGDDGAAYEGNLHPGGRSVVITTEDFASVAAITRWANRHGMAWYGNQRDAQEYLALLQSQSPRLLHGRFTRTAGLASLSFVLPDETIGPEYWRYVAPTNTVGLANMIDLGREGGYEVLDALLHLHVPEVIDPVLAWLALAPLRSKVREFPVLAVTGASGTGKTTLVESVLRHFTGSCITTNLTATTPYAVDSFVGSTNALPIWFDEYRPGARHDTIERLEQVLRDAYTAQPSFKGGLSSNLSQLTTVQTTAPIVVSGEDAFSETSHVERMVLVHLPKDGRDASALRTLRGHGCLARAYLSFVLGADLVVVPDSGVANPRVALNLGVLRAGWSLLRRFVEETYDLPLRDPDFSRVVQAIDHAGSTNPILDLLRWGAEFRGDRPAVWEEGTDLHVAVRNVLGLARQNGTFKLPGNSQAVASYLREQYGAYEQRVRTTLYGQVRVLTIPNGVTLIE